MGEIHNLPLTPSLLLYLLLLRYTQPPLVGQVFHYRYLLLTQPRSPDDKQIFVDRPNGPTWFHARAAVSFRA